MGMNDLGGGRARLHPRRVCGFLGFGTVGRMDPDEMEKEAAGTGGGYPSIPPAIWYMRAKGFGTVGGPSVCAFIPWIENARFVRLESLFAKILQIRHRKGTEHRILNRIPRWFDLMPTRNPDGPMMGMNVSAPNLSRNGRPVRTVYARSRVLGLSPRAGFEPAS